MFMFKSSRIFHFIGFLKRKQHLSNLKQMDLPLLCEEIAGQSLEFKLENVFDKYKLILDVRSPNEFKVDHIKGSVNVPILGNEERSVVGTIYSKENVLTARLLGASLIMRNLSDYLQPSGILLETLTTNIKMKSDHILVYCWRGGQRSKSLALVLSEIFANKQPIHLLNGGYKAYRKHVIDNLSYLVDHITFVGICGLTGSGKTKILQSLKSQGENILDLEKLADHKGSIFGSNVHEMIKTDESVKFSQISQKLFESRLYHDLVDLLKTRSFARKCRKNKLIVWIECESRNIGNVHLPESLWNLIQNCKRVVLETSMEQRIEHIISDYDYWTKSDNSNLTHLAINWLSKHCSKSVIDNWHNLIETSRFNELVHSLLENHYDPIYYRNRKCFMDCKNENFVVKIPIDSLNQNFINRSICPQLIDISKNKFEN